VGTAVSIFFMRVFDGGFSMDGGGTGRMTGRMDGWCC